MRGTDPREVWRVNALGTRNVLDAAIGGGAGRVVHLSSVTVFGFAFPDGVDESYPTEPNGVPYVDTKIASEALVLRAHGAGEMASVVVRPGDVYGPGSRPWTLLPVEEIKRRRFVLPARGRGIFSPVFIDNLVDGIVLAATRPDGAGGVFTLSDGVGVTTAEFFGHYARMLGRRLPTLPTGPSRALAAVAERGARLARAETEVNASAAQYLARTGTYSIDTARRVLGYAPAVSLQDGMARTEAWLRAEGHV
jgi:nucleoside-diphosphate-sugar epimerase